MPGLSPAVSVVIPVYNRAATLPRAVASVLAQDFADWELILVDDGSRDGGVEAILAAGDPRIRAIRHEANRGAPAARNTGIRAAMGRLIAFLDSDDEWLPGKLGPQVAALDAASGRLGALCTGFVLHRVGSGGRFERVPKPEGSWLDTLLDGCTVSPGSTLVARRACFDTAGPFAEDLPRFEDWDWLLRFLEHYDLDCQPAMGALVHLDGHPAPAKVRTAAALLWARQKDRVRRLGGSAAARRLRASLDLECAVAALRAGSRAAALPAVLSAALHSPARVARLLGRGLARVRERDV